ncbi:hypothetical protein ACLMJK_001069 [Lecanora helva]
MVATLAELLSLRRVSPTHLESIHNPEGMGNAANIAYGGFTLAVAINAALQTVPAQYHLYSALGNYLGPAFTDRSLKCSVRTIRSTKTFATRHVEVSQKQDNGQQRLCLFLTADFHIAEPASVFTYSRPPRMAYSSVEASVSRGENRDNLLNRGLVSPEMAQTDKVLFGLADRYLERRSCPEGISTQNLTGLAKGGTQTSQDHLPLSSRTSADYFRAKHQLRTTAEQVSALAFVMDMAISFLPLIHSGRSLTDAGAQSSLDFALRIFTNDLDLNAWHKREWSTVTGGHGRTYTECQAWDDKGNMICNMTQQGILRPKIDRSSKI